MKKLLFSVWQWVWGLPQNLMGLLFWLFSPGERLPDFHGAVVKRWRLTGSASMGMFLFLGPSASRRILVHEFGHSVQSLLLGPLYLPFIFLPSFLWASLPVARRYRQRRNRSYYWLYCEAWANRLGNRTTGELAGDQEVIHV